VCVCERERAALDTRNTTCIPGLGTVLPLTVLPLLGAVP
jgi:hypothetical protein